jgi:hypothetical protein
MSRGIGKNQRKAMIVLWHHDEGIAAGVPLADLKRHTSKDRSNARRSIRGLVARQLAEEVRDDAGERRVRLTGGGHLACWLASYADEELAVGRVPSRPLKLDLGDDLGIDDDTPMDVGYPHGAPPQLSDWPVSDNAPRMPERGDPMQMGRPHANAPRASDRGVSDNRPRGTYTRGLALEIAARMAREWLERLDAEEDA